MAKGNSSSTLAQDVADVIGLSHPIEALLYGALSLLDEYDGPDREDTGGHLFHARQLIEIAATKTAEIYQNASEFNVIGRTKALESAHTI